MRFYLGITEKLNAKLKPIFDWNILFLFLELQRPRKYSSCALATLPNGQKVIKLKYEYPKHFFFFTFFKCFKLDWELWGDFLNDWKINVALKFDFPCLPFRQASKKGINLNLFRKMIDFDFFPFMIILTELKGIAFLSQVCSKNIEKVSIKTLSEMLKKKLLRNASQT